MKGFKFVTFDCYGTLVDWRRGIETALGNAFGRLPLNGDELSKAYLRAESEEEASYKRYRDVLAGTAMRLARNLGLEPDVGAAAEFASSIPAWPAFSDTADALRRLGSLGCQRYVLSNVDSDLLEQTISTNGFEVDGYVTAEEVRSYKPATAHWTRFLEKTGAKKGQTLHVAQSIFHDIIPAGKLGIATAWVNRYREPKPDGVRPTYAYDDLRSVAEALAQAQRGNLNLNNQN